MEGKISQDSPPVAVVGANLAATHTFVVVGYYCLRGEGEKEGY